MKQNNTEYTLQTIKEYDYEIQIRRDDSGENIKQLSDIEYKVPSKRFVESLKSMNHGRQYNEEDNYMHYRMLVTSIEIEYNLGYKDINPQTIYYRKRPKTIKLKDIGNACEKMLNLKPVKKQ